MNLFFGLFMTLSFDSIPMQGKLHVDQSAGFAALQLTHSKEESAALSQELLQACIATEEPQKRGVDPQILTAPVPPEGEEDIGPYVTLIHFTESSDCDWQKLKQLESTAVKIDRLNPHDIIFTPRTRTSSNMFLIGIESEDFFAIRKQIGLGPIPIDPRNGTECHPHITVAVVPLSHPSYPVDPLCQRVADIALPQKEQNEEERECES